MPVTYEVKEKFIYSDESVRDYDLFLLSVKKKLPLSEQLALYLTVRKHIKNFVLL